MTIWVVIPVKPVQEGKSRLASVLSVEKRARLNGILFRRTLDAVLAVFAAEHVIVVSRDGGVRDQAMEQGCRVIAERGDSLNEALGESLRVPVQGDGLLSISTDLPEITAEDVRAMLVRAHPPEPVVTIAPDRAGRGTNALFMMPAGIIPFRFGEDSFAAHAAAAHGCGVKMQVVARPGLAFDLDLPEDLGLCPADWFA